MPDLGPGPALDEADVARASQLASDLATAQDALATASEQARDAQREREQAQTVADALQAQADAAAKRAQRSAASAAALVRSAVSHGPTADPLATVLSGRGDLLGRLGAVDRLRTLSADGERTLRAASADARAAAVAKKKAAAAARTVSAIDVAASEQTVADAQTRVDLAVAALAEVPTVLSADAGWSTLTVDPSLIPDGWTLPVHGPLTDGFGPRPSRPAGTALFHPGDDIGAACGTTIVAAAAGTVVDAGPNGSYGNFILIDHGGGVQTAYGHIRDGGIGVAVGQRVAAGQAIAQVGSTGASTGCHLHLEVRVNGLQIDPMPFFAARGVTIGTR
ncbi:M23 family metallopeptidase [Leifsonia sp. ZF2019]|nr:M23 family metallopeptidase [Leifsonia sp. ZF2019]